MFTIVGSPTHVMPVQERMPALKDEVGGGAQELRRLWTRPMARWELLFPAEQQRLDPIRGFFDFAQGDTAMWFDGAGSVEMVEPVLFGVGDGVTKDFRLSHRHVFVASAIVYVNDAATNAWSPLGNGITMDNLRFTSAPAANAQLKAKYRRKAKVVLDVEADVGIERNFRSLTDPKKSLYRARYFLQEVPF